MQSFYEKGESPTAVPDRRAGEVDIGDGQSLIIRFTSNNHQAALSADYGTSVVLDQAVCEIGTLGGKPIAAANILRLGNSDLRSKYRYFTNLAEGLARYTNTYGMPVIDNDVFVHPRYNDALMINSCVIGLRETGAAATEAELEKKNVIFYLGLRTGREGVTETEKVNACDPLFTKLILECSREAAQKGLIHSFTPLETGGMATALFRLCKQTGEAVKVDLERIPCTLEDPSPRDLLLNEDSSRFILCVPRSSLKELNRLTEKWGLEGVVIGELADSDNLDLVWRHKTVAEIPLQFALAGAIAKSYQLVSFPPMLKKRSSLSSTHVTDEIFAQDTIEHTEARTTSSLPTPDHLEDILLDLLADPNVCSKQELQSKFDRVVGKSPIKRFGSDSGLISVSNSEGSEPKTLALSINCESLYSASDAYLGAVHTVATGMQKLAASGAKKLGLALSLNFGDPARYRELCDIAETTRGLAAASKFWDLPILSKHVSLYNGTASKPFVPSPAVVAVGLLGAGISPCPNFFSSNKDVILLLGKTEPEIECTEYSSYCYKREDETVPNIDFEGHLVVCETVEALAKQGLLSSARSVSAGGVALALTNSCLNAEKPVGATFELENTLPEDIFRPDTLLFSETLGRFVVSCSAENEAQVKERCQQNNVAITGRGEVGGKFISFSGALKCSIRLATAYKVWSRAFHDSLSADILG